MTEIWLFFAALLWALGWGLSLMAAYYFGVSHGIKRTVKIFGREPRAGN